MVAIWLVSSWLKFGGDTKLYCQVVPSLSADAGTRTWKCGCELDQTRGNLHFTWDSSEDTITYFVFFIQNWSVALFTPSEIHQNIHELSFLFFWTISKIIGIVLYIPHSRTVRDSNYSRATRSMAWNQTRLSPSSLFVNSSWAWVLEKETRVLDEFIRVIKFFN